jgi:peptidyl-prolyl cis-trans isomerase SurA
MRPFAIRTSARRRRVALLPLAGALLLAAAGCGGDSSAVPEDAIAVVGDQTVAKADLNRLLGEAKANSRGSRHPFPKPGTRPYLQIREQVVQFLVRRAQIAEEAEARGIELSDEDVEQRRTELVRQYFGGKDDLYEKQLRERGLSEEQALADLEATLIQDALLADIAKDVKVNDAAARKYYAKNRMRYKGRPYEKVKAAVLEDLAQQKRIQATSKYLVGLARRHEVRYRAGFEPRV